MNTINFSTHVLVNSTDLYDYRHVEQRRSINETEEQSGPKQPLPNSSVSITQLWRIVCEQMQIVAGAMASNSESNSEVKKTLIDLQRDTQIKTLREREQQLAEQQKAQKKQKIFGYITKALTVIAVVATTIICPAMGAIMIATIVAGYVIPKLADEIMKAAGVSENVRAKVKLGLEISIAIVGLLATFNPAQLFRSISKTAINVAGKMAKIADKSIDVMLNLRKIILSLHPEKLIALFGKVGVSTVSKGATLLDTTVAALRSFQSMIVTASKQALKSAIKKFQQLMDKLLVKLQEMGNLFKNQFSNLNSLVRKSINEIKNIKDFFQGLKISSVYDKFKQTITSFNEFVKSLRVLKPSQFTDKLMRIVDDISKSIKEFFISLKEYSMLAARINQVAAVGSGVSQAASAGFAIQSSYIDKELHVSAAKQDAFEVKIQQLLLLLSESMKVAEKSLQSLVKVNADYRDFYNQSLSVLK